MYTWDGSQNIPFVSNPSQEKFTSDVRAIVIGNFFSSDELLSYDDRHLALFGNRDHHLEFCGEEVDFFPQEKKFLLAVERGDVASTRRLVFSFGLISDLFAI